jgi:hypothetical protein
MCAPADAGATDSSTGSPDAKAPPDSGNADTGNADTDQTDGSTATPQPLTCTKTLTSLAEADVQAALDEAADGDVVCLPRGSATWSGWLNFSNAKGVTLAGAASQQGGGTTTLTVSAGSIGMNGTLDGDNPHLYRITGISFSNGAGFQIWFYGAGTMRNVRIDHNTFDSSDGAAAESPLLFFGEVTTVANFYGVVDHNRVTASYTVALFELIGALHPSPPPSPFGTGNALFVEDNTMTIANQTNPGLGCVDTWGGGPLVWRHNVTTNCLVTSHGATHNGGPSAFELYDNQFFMTAGADPAFQGCYRCFHHQGSGEFIAFDNRFTPFNGRDGDALAMMDYRAYANSIDNGAPICDGTQSIDGNRSPATTNRGYPCWHQPGRDFAANLKPMYVWNNSWADTREKVDMTMEDLGGSPDYTSNHVQANRDYYNAVSAQAQTSPTTPFDGTSGMGFGTLANRPTTCTTGAETGGGVGYFATDQGAQGTLYRCAAGNMWVVQYAPYAYPHPLAR